MKTTTSNTQIIGQTLVVRCDNCIVGAKVIDRVAGTQLPKRVRLLTGEHVGEVRMLSQYQVIERAGVDTTFRELEELLATVWQD